MPKRRVLLVDDEVTVLLTMKAVLEISGFDVDTAASAREGKSKIKLREYQMVMTDMRMESDAAGREVIQAAREAPYHPAVALLTAYPLSDEDWEDTGADKMLVKPMQTAQLIKSMRSCWKRMRRSWPVCRRLRVLVEATWRRVRPRALLPVRSLRRRRLCLQRSRRRSGWLRRRLMRRRVAGRRRPLRRSSSRASEQLHPAHDDEAVMNGAPVDLSRSPPRSQARALRSRPQMRISPLRCASVEMTLWL